MRSPLGRAPELVLFRVASTRSQAAQSDHWSTSKLVQFTTQHCTGRQLSNPAVLESEERPYSNDTVGGKNNAVQ